MAGACGFEVRLLPRATPELNAMDTLWKQVQRDALADRATQTTSLSTPRAVLEFD